jgi:hypothetical protein
LKWTSTFWPSAQIWYSSESGSPEGQGVDWIEILMIRDHACFIPRDGGPANDPDPFRMLLGQSAPDASGAQSTPWRNTGHLQTVAKRLGLRSRF